MSNPIENLDKVFDNRIRLGIMALLCVNDYVDFNTLKTTLELTDGNLASHLAALENTAYLSVQKQFVGRKPNTRYSVTPSGRKAFADHLSALENLINLTT